MSVKRVVNVTKAFGIIGGIEKVVENLAVVMKELNYESYVIAFYGQGVTEATLHQTLHIKILPTIVSVGNVNISLQYVQEIKRLDSEDTLFVFHSPIGQAELYGDFYKTLKGKKVCFYHSDVDGYGFIGRFYNNIFVRKYLEVMDLIITTSPNIAKTSELLRNFANKIVVIPLGVDTNHFKPCINRDKRKQILNIFPTEVSKIVLYVGRLGRYKGVEYLISAFEDLPEGYGLVIIGEGPKKRELRELSESKAFNNRVLFLNHVPYNELPFYYSAADVFVLPSIDRGEAFGIVAVEAMACGTPVITTELGTGTSYHNIHGKTGLVVPPKDSKSLAEAIRYIVEHKEEFNEEIIRERAEEFSLEKFRERMKRLLLSL